MRILPGALGRVDVILDVLDVPPPLEQEHAQPFLRQLLGRPATGDPRPDHNRVVVPCLHGFPPPQVVKGVEVVEVVEVTSPGSPRRPRHPESPLSQNSKRAMYS